MKRIQIAISFLLTGTAMQAQAREPALQDTPLPISALNADDVEGNIDRLEDMVKPSEALSPIDC